MTLGISEGDKVPIYPVLTGTRQQHVVARIAERVA